MEQYINNTTKQTKAGNKKQNVLNKLKDIVNGKNFGIHKKEKKNRFSCYGELDWEYTLVVNSIKKTLDNTLTKYFISLLKKYSGFIFNSTQINS